MLKDDYMCDVLYIDKDGYGIGDIMLEAVPDERNGEWYRIGYCAESKSGECFYYDDVIMLHPFGRPEHVAYAIHNDEGEWIGTAFPPAKGCKLEYYQANDGNGNYEPILRSMLMQIVKIVDAQYA